METGLQDKPSYFDLFLTFFWMGLTDFGGLAMFAHVRKNIVDKKNGLMQIRLTQALPFVRLFRERL